MTCQSCDDKGVFQVRYHDGSEAEYAVCLCEAGERMRIATNNGVPCIPQYVLWAHRAGIDPARVLPMEDLLTDEEMASRGVTELAPAAAIDAIAAAARARSAKR